MRVSINSPIASLRAEMSEGQFFSLISTAISFLDNNPEVKVPVIPPLQTGGVFKKEEFAQGGIIPPDDSREVVADTATMTKLVEEVISKQHTAPISVNGVPLSPVKTTYKGFLYLQCEECKKFKGFMPKSPISDYRCECGHTTPLKDMKALYVNCKCGQKFKYHTNSKDSYITIDCLNCGAPVDLEYHSRNNNYTTIDGEM